VAGYKDKKNFQPHDLTNLVVTLNGEYTASGIDSIAAEYDDDQFSFQSVGDGTAAPVRNPSRKGTITLAILEADPTNKKLWDLHQASIDSGTPFSISAKDSGAPDFNIKETYAYIQKPPTEGRSAEIAVLEWVMVVGYLDVKGGGYALQDV